jgi:hypothetical protein
MRTFLARKKLKQVRSLRIHELFSIYIKLTHLGVKRENYRQMTTLEIAEKLGPFNYGESPNDGVHRVLRDENVPLDEGKMYKGEW